MLKEEIKRDELCRQELVQGTRPAPGLAHNHTPSSIIVPRLDQNLKDAKEGDEQADGSESVPKTPGLSIGVATPGAPTPGTATSSNALSPLAKEPGTQHQRSTSAEDSGFAATKPHGYFSPNGTSRPLGSTAEQDTKEAIPQSEKGAEVLPGSPTDDRDEKNKASVFVKKLQRNLSNMKLGLGGSDGKPAATPTDSGSEEPSERASQKEQKEFEYNFYGVLQKLRDGYEEQIQTSPGRPVLTSICLLHTDELPLLTPPPYTLVLLQDDDPDAGGIVDTYQNTVKDLGGDADMIEKLAPAWLGEVLLRVGQDPSLGLVPRLIHCKNQIPYKDPVKVSFTLQPVDNELPGISIADGSVHALFISSSQVGQVC